MKSIQVANAFILRHGSDIEAWPYGPVERNVYFTFQGTCTCGR